MLLQVFSILKMYSIVYLIIYLIIGYADMCSESERNLVRHSVIDTIPVDTCNGPMTNGSQYIEGYASGCSFTVLAAVSFAHCFSHCILDLHCKAMKFTASNQCYLCFGDSDTNDSEIEGSIFVETGMFGLYIDGKLFT